jgi:hypothetical protein
MTARPHGKLRAFLIFVLVGPPIGTTLFLLPLVSSIFQSGSPRVYFESLYFGYFLGIVPAIMAGVVFLLLSAWKSSGVRWWGALWRGALAGFVSAGVVVFVFSRAWDAMFLIGALWICMPSSVCCAWLSSLQRKSPST